MLASHEIHEVIEPTLYLILSGMPDTNDALIITDEHISIINSALMAYRDLTGTALNNQDREAVNQIVSDQVSTLRISRTMGISRILNSFCFHTAVNPSAAVYALTKCVVEDTYVSASNEAAKLVLKVITRAA